MFDTLEMAPPDAILGLTEAFKKDPNPEKINLSVGVYQDASGRTPILDCVKEAERRLLESESDKSYLAINGLPCYGRHVQHLVLGPDHPAVVQGRAATLQTPGGTGAVRLAADLLRRKFPRTKVWCSKPTWANHPAIFEAAGLQVGQYDYLDQAGTGFDFDAMLAAVDQMSPGDAICLHACCHNPTGVDPTPEQWKEIAERTSQRGVLPLVDFAYQGFGDGLREDAAGLAALTRAHDELLICSSFSKNFGLYAERTGALTIVAGTPDAAQAALSHAKRCARANYSNPPKHGGAIVSTVLEDDQLRAQWQEEVTAMRERIHSMRQLFVTTMRDKAPQHDFSFLLRQRGMFSFSGLTRVQVDELRTKYSIYIVGSGRINVAGMTEQNMPRLCEAVASVL